MENSRKKILLGLTTTSKSDWRAKTKEIDELGLKEIALFPTCLKKDERRELYGLLEKTGLEHIPHVHLKDDMNEQELEYLSDRYQTELFNTHADRPYKHFLAMNRFRGVVYIENLYKIDDVFKEAVRLFAGICLDVSHWQQLGKEKAEPTYDDFASFLKKYRIGCCHISGPSGHWLKSGENLGYARAYSEYLPEYISLELENSFTEQMKAKEYLKKLLFANS